ncbi:MAG: hypothetical protein ACQERD_05820 [Campylobacterota bacterium]
MGLDLIIPFSILLILVVYLIYTRSKFEKNIVQLYEKKFQEWKSNSSKEQSPSYKELVGIVYKEEYKIKIELLKKDEKDKLLKGKFDICE